jgi:hypothetical protein
MTNIRKGRPRPSAPVADVAEARRRFEAAVARCRDRDGLLLLLRQHHIRGDSYAARGSNCGGGDALMASLSNFLSPGTFARVERDGELFIADGRGTQDSAKLPSPAYEVQLEHEEGQLPDDFYGAAVEPVLARRAA